MKKALIIGMTGNFGSQIALVLHQAGWQVSALVRDVSKIPDWLSMVKIITGDVNQTDILNTAATGNDLIVYAVNPPYNQWHKYALSMLEPVLAIAEKNQQRVLFPGNVYGFAPQQSLIDESIKPNPPTDKGQLRVAMEQRLAQAAQQGAKVTIVRAGDFFGPSMHSSWLDMTLKVKATAVRYNAPHDENHRHHWSYLPDLCTNAVSLVECASADFEVYHDPGFKLTTNDFADAFKQLDKSFKRSHLPWRVFSIVALFNPILREVIKMRYLWQQPVLLSGEKMRHKLGEKYQSTPIHQALETTYFSSVLGVTNNNAVFDVARQSRNVS